MSAPDQSFVTSPGRQVAGEVRVPGDKSISHRAAMLGAIAEGVTEVRGFLEGEDCLATIAALASMGVRIERPATGELRIHGVGPRELECACETARPRQFRDVDAAPGGAAVRAAIRLDPDWG